MTPLAQRIAIAKALGWKLRWQNSGGGPLHETKHKGHSWEVWISPTPTFSTDPDDSPKPPDYLSDLNAMHEVEKLLDDVQWIIYSAWLSKLCGVVKDISATASQRAEAFLRTLSLWEDSVPEPIKP